MSFDPVPWFVGGGAEHSPEVARLLAYVAFRGAEGIVGIGDLRVAELSVPGDAVRVAPGACAILNRDAGGSYQAYAGRLPVEVQASIAPTSAGSGRSDLIVVRVEDPFNAGAPWQDPADPKVGPYVFVRVIAGVPAGTTEVPPGAGNAIPLARIDLPPSTGTVTQAMIVDLRQMAVPRRHRALLTTDVPGDHNLTSSSYISWPSAAAQPVKVPAWAAKAVIRGEVSNVELLTNNFVGFLYVDLGGRITQAAKIDQNYYSNPHRFHVPIVGEVTIPVALRGTTQTVKFMARRSGGTGTAQADTASQAFVDVEFLEHPADDA